MPAPNDSLHAAAEDGNIDTLNRFLAEGEPVDAHDPEGRTPLMYAIHGEQPHAVRHLLKWGAAADAQTPMGGTPLRQAARGGQAEIVRLLLARGADPNQVVHPQPQPKTLEEARKTADFMQKLADRFKDDSEPPKTAEEIVAESERMPQPYRSGAKTLMGAIMSGSAETVTLLLEAGIDVAPPATEINGKTLDPKQAASQMKPLDFAIGQGSLEMVRALVRHGADVHSAESLTGLTSLTKAVVRDDLEIARFLLDSGVDPNAGRMPPLQFAVVQNKIEMAELLLSRGAQTVMRKGIPIRAVAEEQSEMRALLERHQGTDWHYAVVNGDVATVRARLDGGVAIEARNEREETGLFLAAEKGQEEVARLLIERGADVNAPTKVGQTPLMRAAMKGNAEIVRLLIIGGADVNATNRWGRTALYLAQTDNKQEIRELLVAGGASIGLVEAALLGDRQRVEDFLNAGTPADTRNAGGMTALMVAAQNDDVELATLLHQTGGADVGARDERGQTALFYAARAKGSEDRSTDMVRCLLDWGAEVDAEDEDGSVALDQAISTSNLARVILLLDCGTDPSHRSYLGKDRKFGRSLLHSAIQASDHTEQGSDIVRLLLARGADADAPSTMDGEAYKTPLQGTLQHWEIARRVSQEYPAVKPERLIAVVRHLIEFGADVNAQPRLMSKTILGEAIEIGNIELVRLVLDAGARLDADNGANALLSAARFPEITALLRERGASETAPDGTELLPPGMLQRMATEKRPRIVTPPPLDEMRKKMNARRRQRWSGSSASDEEK